MELSDVLNTRRSIRAFTSQQVEQAKLRQILEAGNSAPSAGNLQAYEVYVVTDPQQRKALARAALDQEFLASAPVVLAFCANPARNMGRYGERGRRLYALQDATIACTYAMLTATDLGLATVWVGAFNDDAVSKVLRLPVGLLPVAMLPVGYAAEHPAAAPRRPLDDLVHSL
jgi:nitroreductase